MNFVLCPVFDVYCHPSYAGKTCKAWEPGEKRYLGNLDGFRYIKSMRTATA